MWSSWMLWRCPAPFLQSLITYVVAWHAQWRVNDFFSLDFIFDLLPVLHTAFNKNIPSNLYIPKLWSMMLLSYIWDSGKYRKKCSLMFFTQFGFFGGRQNQISLFNVVVQWLRTICLLWNFTDFMQGLKYEENFQKICQVAQVFLLYIM